MSADFIDPDALVRLVRLYGCLDFSQIARFSCPPGCESKSARRARLKFTAAALRSAVDDGDIEHLCCEIWQSRTRWEVFWDSDADDHVSQVVVPQRSRDPFFSHMLAFNWGKATDRTDVDVYFSPDISRLVFDEPLGITAARLLLPEFFLSRLSAGADVQCLTRDSQQILAAVEDGLDADEFPLMLYREGEQWRVVAAPRPKLMSPSFTRAFRRFRDACHSLGYRCQVLSPKRPKNQWPSLFGKPKPKSESRPREPE